MPLEELEGSTNVVKAASLAWRTPVHDAGRWFYELDWIVDHIGAPDYHGSCIGYGLGCVQTL